MGNKIHARVLYDLETGFDGVEVGGDGEPGSIGERGCWAGGVEDGESLRSGGVEG